MDRYTQRQLQDIVLSAFENIKRELELYAGPPSIDKLRRVVEFKRGKRLVHDQLPLRGGLTGFCIALSDVDLIRTCIDADEPLSETSYIHECIHLLSNDLPAISRILPIIGKEGSSATITHCSSSKSYATTRRQA